MFGLALAARIAFAAQLATAPAPASEGKVIVRLVGQRHNISVVSTPAGVRYSAVDPAGKTIVSRSTLDDLKVEHPDLYRQIQPTLATARIATIADLGE